MYGGQVCARGKSNALHPVHVRRSVHASRGKGIIIFFPSSDVLLSVPAAGATRPEALLSPSSLQLVGVRVALTIAKICLVQIPSQRSIRTIVDESLFACKKTFPVNVRCKTKAWVHMALGKIFCRFSS